MYVSVQAEAGADVMTKRCDDQQKSPHQYDTLIATSKYMHTVTAAMQRLAPKARVWLHQFSQGIIVKAHATNAAKLHTISYVLQHAKTHALLRACMHTCGLAKHICNTLLSGCREVCSGGLS